MKKRVISFVLVIALCIAMMIPVSVNAEVDTTKPYWEKIITVDGDKATLKVTLRGPDSSCAGGQVDIYYPAEKLTYDCPPIAEGNTEMYDEELGWLGIGNGSINGHTQPGRFAANFFSARGGKTDQILCEVTFTINEGYTVNAADFTYEEIIADISAMAVENPTDIIFNCLHTEITTITVDATCDKTGSTTVVCDSCGATVSTETIPATGIHNFVLDEAKSIPATETTDGINFYGCKDCDVTKTENVEKTGVVDTKPYHEKVFRTVGDKIYLTVTLRGPKAVCGGQFSVKYNQDKLEYVSPGVDSDGYELYHNEEWAFSTIDGSKHFFGAVNGLTVPSMVYVSYGSATPAESGGIIIVIEFNIKDGAELDESDFVFVEDLTFGADGLENNLESVPVYIFCEHTTYVEKAEECVAATCVKDGIRVEVCESCGGERVTVVPATGEHDYVLNVEDSKAPTCTENGENVYFCSMCNLKKSDVADALGHDLTTTTINATCTADGVATTTCSRCDYENVVTTPAIGHSYSSVVADPTCEDAGYTTHTCSHCGDSYTDNETEALGHDLTTTTINATCTTDGVATTTCSRCDYENVVVTPAFGHTESDWITDKAATLTEDGSAHKECLVCGTVVETKTLEKLREYGDVNCDGLVSISDAIIITRVIAFLDTAPDDIDIWGDVNGDGSVNMGDTVLVARKIAQLIDKFPVEE